eukprot:c20100_g1_i1 orf=589-1155(+)
MGASAAEPVASPPFTPRLQRQRSLASAISSRCCSNLCIGRNSLSGYDFDDLFPEYPAMKPVMGCASLQRRPQKLASVWQESSFRLLGSRRFKGSRRNIFCNGGGACPEVDEEDDASYCKPSPWKLFLRKLRSETKKMNCVRPSPPGFHYDALSYAMNFDDGGWQPPQQCYHTSMSDMESSSFKLSTVS